MRGGHAEATRTLVERLVRLHGDGHRDGPLVVLQEEDERHLVARREDIRLVGVALACRAVTEVNDGRLVFVEVAGARGTVELLAEGVAGRVERLGADDQRVGTNAVAFRRPSAVGHAAQQAEHVDEVDAAHEGDAVLAVGGEYRVLRTHGVGGADLRGLLPLGWHVERQLALTLQHRRLAVEGSHVAHVAVRAQVVLGAEQLKLLEERLGGLRRLHLSLWSEDLHGLVAWSHVVWRLPAVPIPDAVARDFASLVLRPIAIQEKSSNTSGRHCTR